MTSTLALDLATHTGFAFECSGVRESGVMDFSPRKNEAYGWRFVRFTVWLYKWQKRNLDLVIYEKPIPFHSGQAASQLAFGFSSRVEEFCARYGIRCECVQPSILKKFATGNGAAKKENMIRFAQALKPGVTDDNEADALWLLEYAKAKFMNNKIERSA
jgi:hypothetical protein